MAKYQLAGNDVQWHDDIYAISGALTSGLAEISGNLAAHEAALDPHPQYLTQPEGDVLYAASGTVGGTTSVAGSGLISVGDDIHVQVAGGLLLADDSVAVDFTAVQASGNFITEAHADTIYTPQTRDLIAGSGLTGGGTLDLDRRFDIGAGAGITVTDNAIEVDFTAVQPSGDYVTQPEADTQFLRLDGTNDPMTGDLSISANLDAVSGVFGVGSDTVTISSNGITFAGTAKPWQELRISPTALKVGQDLAPAFGDFVGGLKTYLFEDTNKVQQVYFEVQLPQGIDLTTDIIPHLHYAPAATSANPVQFFFEYAIADESQIYSTTTTISGAQAAGTALEHNILKLGTIDISTVSDNAMLICRLYRDATDGGDTFADDIALLQLNVHYKLSTLGSAISPVQ